MTDGPIQSATHKLSHAISTLIDMQHHQLDTASTYLDSRYDQLRDSLAGTNCLEKSGGQARLPIWCDALDLITEIDTTVTAWTLKWVQPAASTRTRLAHLDTRKWRPQDCDHVQTMTADLERWSHHIDRLLNPVIVKEVTACCPACGARYHWRDHAGERVRIAALQVTIAGHSSCLVCHTSWPPLFLLRLLDGQLPPGVLE